MNNNEIISNLQELRKQGITYKTVSALSGVPINSIYNFVRKKPRISIHSEKLEKAINKLKGEIDNAKNST